MSFRISYIILFLNETIDAMHKRIFFLLFISCIFYANAQYHYSVDLINIYDDKVKVSCITPLQTANEVDFIFPNVIPGSYAYKEYGYYIDNFVAYDKNGTKLKVKKTDKYNFKILNATQLYRIEYKVNDTWDSEESNNFIFQPGGTNIAVNDNFVINHYGFFGYIDGQKNVPYYLNFFKPEKLTGYSHLTIHSLNNIDSVYAPNYDLLADNPLFYIPKNDTSFYIGKTKIDICLYAKNQRVSIADVLTVIYPVAKSLENFFGTLPTDHYIFMFYLTDPATVPKRTGSGLSSGFGAMEHNNCSVYFMPEYNNRQATINNLTDVVAHEFLHILTPLNIHSTRIENFNFRNPKMSKHLWMYEGMTEYFSNLILLRDSIKSESDFLKEIRSKIIQSAQFDNFSMTDMSENILTPQNQSRYLSVYSRGALLAMALDIQIIKSTEGKITLKDVMMELTKKYGPNHPFEEDSLIPEIVRLTHPSIQRFFDTYIIGEYPLDYKTMFAPIGLRYESTVAKEVYSFGSFGMKYNPKTEHFRFVNVGLNAFGIENNDELLKIDGKEIRLDNGKDMFEYYFDGYPFSQKIKIIITRNGTKYSAEQMPIKAVKTINNYLEWPAENKKNAALFYNAFMNKR